MSEFVWVLYVMDAATAEPMPVLTRPFTRFEMRRMDSAVRALEAWGTPARFDKVRREVALSWTT